MKKYRATYDAHRYAIIEAETYEEASKEGARRCPRGFDYADLQEVIEVTNSSSVGTG